jgi:hypothetical protein
LDSGGRTVSKSTDGVNVATHRDAGAACGIFGVSSEARALFVAQLQDGPRLDEVAPSRHFIGDPQSAMVQRVNAIAAGTTFGVYSLYQFPT